VQYHVLADAGDTNDGMSSCSDCGLDVDHCHGTLIMHDDRAVDCTDVACDLPDLFRHAFIVDCIAVRGGCCRSDELIDWAEAS
jgi:hypothetical protein